MTTTVLPDGTLVPNYYTNADFNTSLMSDRTAQYDTKNATKNSLISYILGLQKSVLTGTGNPTYDTTTLNRYNNATMPNTTTDTTDYNVGYQALLGKNANVKTTRANLDTKISFMNSSKNLNNTNDSYVLYNATLYMTILWTILATSLLYYIFVEM
jgi:hypothetical protein